MHLTVENSAARQILRTYVTLMLLPTFASSMIWGINTLFLLDAGLSVSETFAANAFFTVGMVAFEVPAALVAGAQVLGGVLVPHVARVFRRRMSVLLAASGLTTGVLVLMGLVSSFWVAIALLALWATAFA